MTVHPSLLTVLLLSLLCPSVGQQQKAVIKFVQTSYVVDEGQQVSIEVSKTGFSAPPLNVVVMVVMLSDQNGSNDFVGNSQALTFPNNSYNITRSVSFFVLDDDIPERDEVFTLQLLLSTNSSEKAMKGDPSEATITVRANDDAFGIFAFAEPSPYTVSEGPSSVQVPLTIQRNRGTFGNISVNFDLSGSALVSEDITPVSGTLLFLEGESSKDLILTILGDNIPENDETFVVTLTSATGGASINLTQDRLQLVIPANDAPVRFTQGEYRVEETAMSIDLSVTITRGLTEDGQTFIGPITKDAYVYVTCISGSATAGQDFSCASNTSLVFQAGETSKSFTIQILPDDAAEIAEEFYIVLFNPSSDVVVSDPYNVSVIIGANDETHGVLSLKSPSATSFPQTYVNEDTTSQLTFFTVIRSGGAFGTVSVDWILSRNDSNPDSAATDVTPVSGTVQLSEGMREVPIVLSIVQDSNPEPMEMFFVRLLPATVTGGARAEGILEGSLIVEDSDDAYGSFILGDDNLQGLVTTSAPRRLRMTIVRNGGQLGEVVITYNIEYSAVGVTDLNIFNISMPSTVTVSEGTGSVTVEVPIKENAFLKVGGSISIQLIRATLAKALPVGPFNSPRIGAQNNSTFQVTGADGNGEIGFAVTDVVRIAEPNATSSQKLEVALIRDGTNGAATVYWTLAGSGDNASYVTAGDAGPTSGTVVMTSGQSQATITIYIYPDIIPEIDEEMTLTLTRVEPSNTQKLRTGASELKIVITENDNPGGVFEFSEAMNSYYAVQEEGQAVEFSVVRTGGDLVVREVQYYIEPNGDQEFYGATNVLKFPPGVHSQNFTIIARGDNVPELSENFALRIRDYKGSSAVIGPRSRINITVLENDDARGVVSFAQANLQRTIDESKGSNIYSAEFPLSRQRGLFGMIGIQWRVEPLNNADVAPLTGTVEMVEGQSNAVITVQSRPDNIPESQEQFTITLLSTTGGARLGTHKTATLNIIKNDDAIYFTEQSMNISVAEVTDPSLLVQGGEVTLTVVRDGPATSQVTVKYRTIDGSAKAGEGDYDAISGNTLTFAPGQNRTTFTVFINDDDVPETQEYFQVELFDPQGDAVVYSNHVATITIKANDQANGVFSFSPPLTRTIEEGEPAAFEVRRSRGLFGQVNVQWEIIDSSTQQRVPDNQDFQATNGQVTFNDQEERKNIMITALADGEPEHMETYAVRLTAVTGGGPNDEVPLLASQNLQVAIQIDANDDPYGVLGFSAASREKDIAEDFYPGQEATTRATFTVERAQGLFGAVEVVWQIFSDALAGTLPEMKDLLFLGTRGPGVTEVPDRRRPGTQTMVLQFTGNSGAYVTIPSENQPSISDMQDGYTLSAWIQPAANDRGFILCKSSSTLNDRRFYGMAVSTNATATQVEFHYSNTAQNMMAHVSSLVVTQDGQWHLLIVAVGNGNVQFYVDGNLQGTRTINTNDLQDGPGNLLVGALPPGSTLYGGLMQDVRIYTRKLLPGEIQTLYTSPSDKDVTPISGYLVFNQGTKEGSIQVSSKQDVEEESNEVFTVKLISVKGGARISNQGAAGKLTVLKSDNANGLFSFAGPCMPSRAGEGVSVRCRIERHRGDAGTVNVNWEIRQDLGNGTTIPAPSDFSHYNGQLTFIPGDRVKNLIFTVTNDNIPELIENFNVLLTSVMSDDGIIGTTNTSGASIDPALQMNRISVNQSDYPYGLLQFSTGAPPSQSDQMILPASQMPHIRINEEIGIVHLLVVRAQGLRGDVAVEWRTIDGTAKSSGKTQVDFQAGVNRLNFGPGQRYDYINISIIDNAIPEDDKYFLVKLLNPTGGAETGLGSTINITIASSDDAYGKFQFTSDSLTATVNETGDTGFTVVNFKVERLGGKIGSVTVFWQIENDVGNDLVENSGSVTFVSGEETKVIGVKVRGDPYPELDEFFVLKLTGVNKGELGNSFRLQANLTVLSNDDPYGVFTITDNNRPIRTEEGDHVVTLTVQRQQGFVGLVRVNYTTLDATEYYNFLPGSVARANESDFVPVSGYVQLGLNQNREDFDIHIRDDQIPEGDESVFVRLTSVELISGGQSRPVSFSPRLGPNQQTYAQIIINQNDNANGILELSTASVAVSENFTGSIVDVVRKEGSFGEVSVKFEVISGTAVNTVDYSVTSSDVILADRERRKRVPVEINDDRIAELNETFTIRLLPQITGGAQLGRLISTQVTILSSDDPKGAFEFSTSGSSVEEPESQSGQSVEITVSRMGGTLDVVAVQWEATLNGVPATADVSPTQSTIYFTSNQASEKIVITVLPDDEPEDQEDILITLTAATNGGRVGSRNVFRLTILPNDDPHGIVQFEQDRFVLKELSADDTQHIKLTRSGGSFGQLRVSYSTEQVDILAIVSNQGQDILDYYTQPVYGANTPQDGFSVDVSGAPEPVEMCARTCLSTRACLVFQYNSTAAICTWFTSGRNDSFMPAADVRYYMKNVTKAMTLYDIQAESGQDYTPVTGASVIIQDGASSGTIPIQILADRLPELDERFLVRLTNVELVSGPPSNPRNNPRLGNIQMATVVIDKNDDANGIFSIFSNDPRALNGGRVVEVEEREKLFVDLVVERGGGSIGEVYVMWSVDQSRSNATKGIDFIADGASLIFGPGETRRALTIGIIDDDEAEDDENILIFLSNPQGGAVIGPNNTVNVIIMANDNVGGTLGFAQSSVLAREGDNLTMVVQRSRPARGNASMDWEIKGLNGLNPALGFRVYQGSLVFKEGELEKTISLHILEDATPEVNEEYRIFLKNLVTSGVRQTGEAILDPQSYVASITIQGSNDPHGVFQFASSSMLVHTPEANTTVQLMVDRKFGAIGDIRVYYEIKKGSVSNLNVNKILAEPGQDFVPKTGSIVIHDGANSGNIEVQIVDDEAPEVDEVFIVSLTRVEKVNPDNSTFEPSLASADITAEVLISANDGTKGEVYFPADSARITVNETNVNFSLTIVRGRGTFGNVSVFVYARSLGEGARTEQDYSVKTQDVVFLDGETTKQVMVQVFDDNEAEADEQFEVVLASPKEGLLLGEPHRAVITITANDGAGGTVNFDSDANITLVEPTGANTLGSKAELRLTRGPGVFGVVVVPFLVLASKGGNVTDVTPVDGFVTFQDREGSRVLQISAVADNIPELLEAFTVILGPPQGGATLGNVRHRTIFIAENDSPYGLMQIYPMGMRNSSISVEESVGQVYFEIIRSQGLLGRVTVDVATRSDSAQQSQLVFGVNLTLSSTQTIKSTGASSWHSFKMADMSYALLVNSHNARGFNTTIGSDGSAGFLTANDIRTSVIYRWQGVYVPIQTIETDGGTKATTFTYTSREYIIIANHGSLGRYETYTRVYAVLDSGTLQVLQDIPSRGAKDVTVFTAGGQNYLVIANYIDNNMNTNIDSAVYQWDMNNRRFINTPVQMLSTHGASSVTTFEISGVTYLAVANHYDSQQQDYEIDSVIFKLGTDNRFTLHQSIPSKGATAVEAFTVGATTYLMIGNNRNNAQNSQQMSALYKWENNAFVKQQDITTNGVQSIKSYVANNGIRQLAVANAEGNSQILIWNGARNQLDVTWTGPPAVDLQPIRIEQESGPNTLIAEAAAGTTLKESHIYLTSLLGDSDYVPRTTTLIFEPGRRRLETAITVLEDELPEDTETFYVYLQNPQGGAELGPHRETAIHILANDNAYGIIEFADDSLVKRVEELDGRDNRVQLNVVRTRGTVGSVIVHWTASGDHNGQSDISPLEGTVEFPPGQSVATITLTIKQDTDPENDELTFITLDRVVNSGSAIPGEGATIGTKQTSRLTVIANDSPYGVVSWQNTSITSVEPTVDTTVSLVIIREQGAQEAIQVAYITERDTSLPSSQQAVSGRDYQSKQGSVTMQAGETSAEVQITIKPDDDPEPAETFLVNITGVQLIGQSNLPIGAQPSIKRPGNIVTVTIAENDNARGFVQFNVTKNIEGRLDTYEEPGKSNILSLPLSRSVGFFGTVSVTWQAVPRTATTDDFTPSSGTVTFVEGQKTAYLNISILDDQIPEDVETFEVQLLGVTGGAVLGAETSVTVAIMKNDSPYGLFGFATTQKTVQESKTETDANGQVTFDIVRTQGSEGTVTVGWRLEAAAQNDFQPPWAGTVTFGPSETSKSITLRTRRDTILEGEEQFRLTLISTDLGEISPISGEATIVILPDAGATGIISILDDYKHIFIGEPSSSFSGHAVIRLSRGIGNFGEVKVGWQITPSTQAVNAFTQATGEATFADGQQFTEINLQAEDDDIPEARMTFTLKITSATGGATISTLPGANEATVVMVASDYPHGLFEFSPPAQITEIEFDKQVSVSIVRNGGSAGQVRVTFATSPGTATAGQDYVDQSGTLTFAEGQTRQTVIIRIRDDDVPEGPEQFYVNITKVELQTPSINNYTLLPNGLQLDMPPGIGPLSTKIIVIDKNDNAEGVIEFAPESISFIAREEGGIARVPVIRKLGSYGRVSATFSSSGITATAGLDYLLQDGEIVFGDGMMYNTINITVRDDSDREMAETLDLRLTGVSGGARLGAQTTSMVTIAKSDYPNGKFSFLGQTEIIIPNPAQPRQLTFTIARTEGQVGFQTLRWRILGPNNFKLVLEETNDVAYQLNNRELTSGTLSWGNNEGGAKTFTLTIKPHTVWEIQKIFVIEILDIQASPPGETNGEVDPLAGNVTLTILKHGDPNGIVHFSGVAQSPRTAVEPSAVEGGRLLSFPLYRREGTIGNIVVQWQVVGPQGSVPDIEPMKGNTTIAAEKRDSEILLRILPDDEPELDETFTLQLLRVEGGAEVDTQFNTSTFTIQYNDDPHGVFGVESKYQTVIVDTVDYSRHVRINITRFAGSVGTVRISYGIVYDQPELQSNRTKRQAQSGITYVPGTDSVTFQPGQTFAIKTLRAANDVFLEEGSTFTLTLTDVNYIGVAVATPPRLAAGQAVVKVVVPPEAANSIIGFDKTVVNVNDTNGIASLVVSRRGTYGRVEVDWQTGYPQGQAPQGFASGTISPDAATVILEHGIPFKIVNVQVFPVFGFPELFAAHIAAAPRTPDSVAGGARLNNGFTLVEIEPSGVMEFAPNSRDISVDENAGEVRLHLRRVYGSNGNVVIRYATNGATATAGADFTELRDGSTRMTSMQTNATVLVEIKPDNLPETEEHFFVNLTMVESLPTNARQGISPRLSTMASSAKITINRNSDPYGVLSVTASPAVAPECNSSVTTPVCLLPSAVRLTVFRSGGTFGTVSVKVRTVGGGEAWDRLIVQQPSDRNDTIGQILANRNPDPFSHAALNSDYQVLDTEVTMLDGEVQKVVTLDILDDTRPEPDESLFVYLTEPTGGARIAEGQLDGTKRGYAMVIIRKNDNWNGVIGFRGDSLYVTADEDGDAVARLTLIRVNGSFGEARIKWKVVGADDQVVDVEGEAVCAVGQTTCPLNVLLRKDDIPEYASSFLVQLPAPEDSAAGYRVNDASKVANVTMLPSDYPDGLVQFAQTSLLKTVGKNERSVRLEVQRIKGKGQTVQVDYATKSVDTPQSIAGVRVYSALDKADYSAVSGKLLFDANVESQYLVISLSPVTASDNPYPKMFQVVLGNPTSGASLNKVMSVANVTIVETDEQKFWDIRAEALLPEMTDNNINNLINDLKTTVGNDRSLSNNELHVTEYILDLMIQEGETRPLPLATKKGILSIFCELLDPTRTDSTRGQYELIKLFERFTFICLTNQSCQTPEATDDNKELLMFDNECTYVRFGVARWYPDYINGFEYKGLKQDYFNVPIQLLDTTAEGGVNSANPTCQDVHFIEYSSEQWFNPNANNLLLAQKVLTFSIRGRTFGTISSPVKFRVNTDNRRITARRAQCVYFEESTQAWTSGSVCRATNDLNLDLGIDSFVDCECSHLSSYAVQAQTSDPNLVWYPIWFFISCFIAMTGLALAILSHHICSIYSMFAANLLMHMCFATMATEICYVVAAYISPEILVPPTADDNSRCIILGLFTHYFFLAQFTWMFTQAINFWKILVLNDEHTDRKYVLYFLTGWGLPAIIVAAFYVITYNLYKFVYNVPENYIYGDVNLYGEMCFIVNPYAALGGVIGPILVCLFVIGIAFIHAFQVTPQWQAYDDVYRGRYNINEVRTILFFWATIILTWLWGGLHMAYGELWMLIFFCIFNTILGLFALVVYCALRNPCLPCFRPQKASYSLDITGGSSADGMQYHPRPPSVTGSLKGSRASLINESWERDSTGVPNGQMRVKRTPASNGNIYVSAPGGKTGPYVGGDDDVDSQEFDDLIFALKTGGSGIAPSETSSHDQDGAFPAIQAGGSPGYEMRRISIADTHL